ncbi:MAG: LysR family transcriptional regulator [Reyranellaceae bacterium]
MDALPPLNSLLMFEAAARLGRFTRAALELDVTHSAASRQVVTLEARVDKRLFHRSRNGTTLTPAGEPYCRHPSQARPATLLGLKRRINTSVQTAIQKIHVIVGCRACHSRMRR